MLVNAARWSLGRGNAPVPSRWQATSGEPPGKKGRAERFLGSARVAASGHHDARGRGATSDGGFRRGGIAALPLTGLSFPAVSAFDPPTAGEGSIDPMGLAAISDRLADLLVPGLRARMSRVRFVTAMAVGSLACEPLADEPTADGISPHRRSASSGWLWRRSWAGSMATGSRRP